MTRLQTELRHVDIHNHWLRQEGRINVVYVKSKATIADGFYEREGFQRFRDRILLAGADINSVCFMKQTMRHLVTMSAKLMNSDSGKILQSFIS
jgi:hypothetical protein